MIEQLFSLLKKMPEYTGALESLRQGENVAITGIGQINRSHILAGLCRELGSQDFPRVKIGVGAKPNPDYDLADWVLGSFSALDEKAMDVSLENAGHAALAIIDKGVPEAANRFNGSHP